MNDNDRYGTCMLEMSQCAATWRTNAQIAATGCDNFINKNVNNETEMMCVN